MKRLLLVLVLVLIPCVAGAANWKQVFGDYEYTVSVDANSVKRAKEVVRAWVRQIFSKKRLSGDYAYDSLNGLNSFDCKNKKVSLLQVEVFDGGKQVDSYKPNAAADNRPIIPGTVEYFAYRYLCVSKGQ